MRPFEWWHATRTGGDNAISIGEGTLIAPEARLDGAQGVIRIGGNCQIHHGALLLPYGGFIHMGDNCSVNPYSIIYGHGGVSIGKDVRIATHVVIVASNHIFSDPATPIYAQGVTTEGISIEDDVWIGANVTILDGAKIGRGSVIAAGSVVRGRVEPFSVMGGVPARLIKQRC
ncbi:MAG: acyltransferase [Methylacidiphilales bacterium]|nr:acyltransferase [Candidatus Methylacidiphilales bacterium]